MDNEKLIYEVEKYKELYDPQNTFYKDNSKKKTQFGMLLPRLLEQHVSTRHV